MREKIIMKKVERLLYEFLKDLIGSKENFSILGIQIKLRLLSWILLQHIKPKIELSNQKF